MRLVLGSYKRCSYLLLFPKTLKVYTEALIGSSHISSDGNNTLFFQGCIFENSYHCENNGQDIYSEDRGGDEAPLTAQVLITGQPVIMSSQ